MITSVVVITSVELCMFISVLMTLVVFDNNQGCLSLRRVLKKNAFLFPM